MVVRDFLSSGGSERFSAAMAILNLIFRPFTTLVLYRIYVERANATGTTVPTIFGEYFYYITEYYNLAVCCLMSFFPVSGTNILIAFTFVGTQQRSPYEDIGGMVHQTVPTNVPSPSSKVPPPYHA